MSHHINDMIWKMFGTILYNSVLFVSIVNHFSAAKPNQMKMCAAINE